VTAVGARVDESEEDIFLGLGFSIVRRLGRYLLPTESVPVPDGYAVLPAAAADPARLAAPDAGAGASHVAVAADGGYVGALRVEQTPAGPRVDHVGVLPAHRRRGLAAALLGRAAAERPDLRCEVDDTDVPANALLARLGAVRTGGLIEVER
jgi:GNAT superfamily N-acetyltransferase